MYRSRNCLVQPNYYTSISSPMVLQISKEVTPVGGLTVFHLTVNLDGYVFQNMSLVVINKWIKWILSSVMKCEKWTDQHDMSVGQRKNLSPWQQSNSWPLKHQAGALSYTMIWIQFKLLCSQWVLVAQWIECLPGVWEFMGLIPVGNSDFFFVPRSCHVDHFTFHIFLIFISPVCLFRQKEISFPKVVTDLCCVTKRT